MTGRSQDLCESLKMQNNKACYKRMRLDILATSRKHLDPDTSCSSQVEPLQALKDELVTRWPDFFGGNDDNNARAIKRAMAYVRQHHSTSLSKAKSAKRLIRRGSSRGKSVAKVPKKRIANTTALVKQEQPSDLELPSVENTQIPLVERMTRNLEYYASQVPPSTPAESSGPSVPSNSAPYGHNRALRPCVEPTTSKPGPSVTTTKYGSNTTMTPLPTRFKTLQTAQPSQSLSEPASSPPYASSSQVSRPRSCPFGSTRPMPMANPLHMNVQSIHQFLRTCLPPMDHFLHRFINAGLRTEEGLLGASRWGRELIESFLDQLPPHPDGSPVLLMEKLVLMHQFTTYFL